MNQSLPNFIMPIITPRLILRPPEMTDAKIVNAAILESIKDLSRFMPWAKTPPSLKDTENFIQQALDNLVAKKNEEPYLPLFIFEKVSGEFLGSTGFHHMNWEVPCFETGYWLRTSAGNHGYMTEAVNAITRYAFIQLGAKRIAITCQMENLRSKKIPERLGYVLEGILKSNRRDIQSGALTDTLMYAKYDLDGLPDLKVEW